MEKTKKNLKIDLKQFGDWLQIRALISTPNYGRIIVRLTHREQKKKLKVNNDWQIYSAQLTFQINLDRMGR